ncbi:reprolysin-like metallopeptidase [Sungkyunkwania multivorans]|uniref:Reprolysin-like metallopeptidase n=1 Tax=Sungkyunkwania multivorans TaxID=1173618 RepID=A0ABW3CUQ4_9FLAO
MRTALPFVLFFVIAMANAQSRIWQPTNESQALSRNANQERVIIPNQYKVFSLNATSLRAVLKNAPARFTEAGKNSATFVDFPFEDGRVERFKIQKATVMHPELEAKFPQIRAYVGQSMANPLNKIYFTDTQLGFRGLITGEKTIYIDPYAKGNTVDYIVYDRKNYNRQADDDWRCYADDLLEENDVDLEGAGILQRDIQDGRLRRYDIAISCTSEYTNYHDDGNNGNGDARADALAAMVITVARVNSVYERDLGVTFQLIANNNELIYFNGFAPGGDPEPYDNYDGGQMLSVNTSNITGIIGSGAYDIGHVFSTGGGGIAGTSPCATSSKGRGVTGIVTPEFDPFDIDYVSHEIGHQYGAGHTYYNACFGSKVSNDYEPGSASTILGYAGICVPNVQENSDAYFHARSIAQMSPSILGDACETEIVTGNTAPVANAGSNYTIPRSTPFILDGGASSDANGDTLTYCWEQYDNDGTYTQPPLSTNAGGPIFRTNFPVLDATRTFPNLEAIINNQTPTWEVLPSVGRQIDFRLTVRDNNINGGNTDHDDMIITVSGTAGPFVVNAPNTGSEIWYAGATETVTWSVNSTNSLSPNVNILLSTDGGYTYPITLASGVTNDGSHNITVPNNVGTNNRIKIEAASNIFFDISNQDFEIKAGTFEMVPTQNTVSTCQPTDAVFTFDYTPAPGFGETVTFSALNEPSGSSVGFSPASASTATTVTMTVSNIGAVTVGKYDFDIQGQSTSATETVGVSLNVFDNNIENSVLLTPSNGAGNQSTTLTLTWQPLNSASEYDVEISRDPKFATIDVSATVQNDNSYSASSLIAGEIYFWRVRPRNTCITGNFSELFVFQTANDTCITYDNEYFENGDNVWESGSNNAVSARVDVADNIIVNDVSFYMRATHSNVGVIKMQFSSPSATFSEIYNRDCSSGSNFDCTFTDSGSPLSCFGTPRLSGNILPGQAFTRFQGENAQGTWVLLATDRSSSSGTGTFNEFSVTICGELQIVNDVAVDTNLGLTLDQNSSALIDATRLSASQSGASASQIVYVVTELPAHGDLLLNASALAIGDTFTQDDVNNNLLNYSHDGSLNLADSFDFAIEGNNTALKGGETFNFTMNPTVVLVAAKAYLQGAMIGQAGTLMSDTLRANGVLPLASPYTDAITTTTPVLAATGNDAIVDWVWLELYSSPSNTLAASRSALVQRDGDIVDVDGTSAITMSTPPGDYFLVIGHRNHLNIKSANFFSMSTTSTVVDLSSSTAAVEGTSNAVKSVGSGIFALIVGDFDENGQVQNTDVAGIRPLLGQSGYDHADLDMNGQIQLTDINLGLRPNIGNGIQY